MNVHETRLRDAAWTRPAIHSLSITALPGAHCNGGEGRGRGGRGGRPQRALSEGSASTPCDSSGCWASRSASVRRRRRIDLGGHRDVLHTRPRLLLHRDDLRDASDQGRLPGPAWRRLGLARNADAPRGGRADAAGVVDEPKARTAATSASVSPRSSARTPRSSLVRNAT